MTDEETKVKKVESGSNKPVFEEKMDIPTAEQEFQRFVDAHYIDMGTEFLDDNDRRDLNFHKRILVKAILRGDLEIDEHGKAIYTPQTGRDTSALKVRPINGAMLMATDKKKFTAMEEKDFVLLAGMTGTDVKWFSRMEYNPDLLTLKAILELLRPR